MLGQSCLNQCLILQEKRKKAENSLHYLLLWMKSLKKKNKTKPPKKLN